MNIQYVHAYLLCILMKNVSLEKHCHWIQHVQNTCVCKDPLIHHVASLLSEVWQKEYFAWQQASQMRIGDYICKLTHGSWWECANAWTPSIACFAAACFFRVKASCIASKPDFHSDTEGFWRKINTMLCKRSTMSNLDIHQAKGENLRHIHTWICCKTIRPPRSVWRSMSSLARCSSSMNLLQKNLWNPCKATSSLSKWAALEREKEGIVINHWWSVMMTDPLVYASGTTKITHHGFEDITAVHHMVDLQRRQLHSQCQNSAWPKILTYLQPCKLGLWKWAMSKWMSTLISLINKMQWNQYLIL